MKDSKLIAGLFAAAAFALASLSAHAQQEGAMAGAAVATADSTLQAKVKAALADRRQSDPGGIRRGRSEGSEE
jgi:hyperosmotically inducible protein